MARNIVGTVNLTEGAAWTFVHSDGRRTVYEYHRQIVPRNADPKNPHVSLDAMHSLLNPATGKLAHVSEKWMMEGPITSAVSPTGVGSHWLVGEQVEELADAA